MKPSAEELLAFIQANEASLTFATSEPKQRSWRCCVYPRHFLTPDIRERAGRCGFGTTAMKAVVACMNDSTSGFSITLTETPAKKRKAKR